MPIETLDALLNTDELAKLRKDYDREVLFKAVKQAFAYYPPIAPLVDSIIETHYRKGVLSARDRERCLIALFAAQRDELPLAVHIYWGLMEGLSPEEIGATLMLVASYEGINRFAKSGKILRKTLTSLKSLLGASSEAPTSAAVLTHLLDTFSGVSD